MPVAQFSHNLINIGKRQYRNPVCLAKEWRSALDSGEYSCPAALSRHLRVSRARVAQIMNLLNLSSEAIDIISSVGDPVGSPIVAERKLRPLLGLVAEQQIDRIKIMLSNEKTSPL
jgi:hypothetical protein